MMPGGEAFEHAERSSHSTVKKKKRRSRNEERRKKEEDKEEEEEKRKIEAGLSQKHVTKRAAEELRGSVTDRNSTLL